MQQDSMFLLAAKHNTGVSLTLNLFAPEEVRWLSWKYWACVVRSIGSFLLLHTIHLPGGFSCTQSPEHTQTYRYTWFQAACSQEALLSFNYVLYWLHKNKHISHPIPIPLCSNITFSSCSRYNDETLRRKIGLTFGRKIPILQASLRVPTFPPTPRAFVS